MESGGLIAMVDARGWSEFFPPTRPDRNLDCVHAHNRREADAFAEAVRGDRPAGLNGGMVSAGPSSAEGAFRRKGDQGGQPA